MIQPYLTIKQRYPAHVHINGRGPYNHRWVGCVLRLHLASGFGNVARSGRGGRQGRLGQLVQLLCLHDLPSCLVVQSMCNRLVVGCVLTVLTFFIGVLLYCSEPVLDHSRCQMYSQHMPNPAMVIRTSLSLSPLSPSLPSLLLPLSLSSYTFHF